MRNSIYTKLFITYLLFALLGFLVLSCYTQPAMQETSLKEESYQLYREAVFLANDYAASLYRNDLTVEELSARMTTAATYTSSDVWLMDSMGNVLLDSNTESTLPGQSIEDFNIMDFSDSNYITGDFYGIFAEDQLSTLAPVTINYQIRGYVVIHKPISEVETQSNDYSNTLYVTLGFFIIISLIFLVMFTLFSFLPTRRIIGAAKFYAKGDFSKKIKVGEMDEMGYIANTMNFMATELDTLEDDQRKFVSNVSHDFRSPLTSIRGYLEAMLDGTIPPELHEKYLKIILSETGRLTKLTQNLLDLNQFGQRGLRMEFSNFDMNQLIREVLPTFEGTCAGKGITFDLTLTGEELMIHADYSKIQQVLYNLIDNAIKFSHNDSSIDITTRIKNEKALISVKDHGIGIPADATKKIFDRFYKTDLSRGKDKKGSGLGLAIVKEIINSHNETINVISTEGVGTEFMFTMPLSKEGE